MTPIFVTGTDTNVGKSTVTALIAGYLAQKGHTVTTQKWIQTGCSDKTWDLDRHNRWLGEVYPHDDRYAYAFDPAVSPHLAAKEAGVAIDPARISDQTRALATRFEYVIIEGSGGWYVPYSESGLMADLVQDLNLPVLLVAANRLGAINHTLLTIESIQNRRLPFIGTLFTSPSANENPAVSADNPAIIASISGTKTIGILPFCTSEEQLSHAFSSIGDRLYKTLR